MIYMYTVFKLCQQYQTSNQNQYNVNPLVIMISAKLYTSFCYFILFMSHDWSICAYTEV